MRRVRSAAFEESASLRLWIVDAGVDDESSLLPAANSETEMVTRSQAVVASG